MAEEVYIELEVADGTGEKYRVDLAPVNMAEETAVKDLQDMVIETDQDEGIDPINVVTDTKKVIHNFVLTGNITQTPDDTPTTTNAEKKRRLRILMALKGNVTNTRLRFHYGEEYATDYFVFMNRLSFTQGAGEDFFNYTIELLEGVRYQDETW